MFERSTDMQELDGRQASQELKLSIPTIDNFKVSLPRDNLLEALLSPRVRCILIKGEPGCGKTTVAIDLMAKFGRGIYISTRSSLQEVARQNKTLADLVQRQSVTELVFETKTGLRFEDYRLGTAADVLSAIMSAPQTVGGEPLIVLDTWDFFGKLMDPVDRQKTEQALFAMTEANQMKLIFVGESVDLTTMDYMVDAVLLLEDGVFEGQRVRRAVWKKLRSFEIPKRTTPYTLYGGKFSLLTGPEILREIPKQVVYSPKKHGELQYSSGSEDLDSFLGGGIPHGAFILLELGEHVGTNWHIPLTASIMSNFIGNGGCAVTIPSLGLTPPMVKSWQAKMFPMTIVNSSLKVCHFYEEQDNDPCFVQLDNTTIKRAQQALSKASLDVKKGGGRPCCFVIGMEVMEDVLGEENLREFGAITSIFLKKSGDVFVSVVKHGSSLLTKLSNSCDLHLKLDQIDCVLIMHSIKPPSRIYNMNYDYELGYPQVKLTPMV